LRTESGQRGCKRFPEAEDDENHARDRTHTHEHPPLADHSEPLRRLLVRHRSDEHEKCGHCLVLALDDCPLPRAGPGAASMGPPRIPHHTTSVVYDECLRKECYSSPDDSGSVVGHRTRWLGCRRRWIAIRNHRSRE
jgi:hypothetical protein